MIAALALMVLGQAQVQPQLQSQPDPCEGSTTIAVNQCLANQRDSALAEMNRYLDAARIRSIQQAGDPPLASKKDLLTGFDAAQDAWEKYRSAQCGNIYDFWRSGTIRGAMALDCDIRLIRARTHFLWESFLTYPDSTPPILPEPASGNAD